MNMHQVSIYCIALAAVLLLSGCADRKHAADLTAIPTVTEVQILRSADTPTEPASVVSPENQEVQKLAEEFSALYFAKDRDSMAACLAEGYGDLIDVYPYDGAQVVIQGYRLPQSVVYALSTEGHVQASVPFLETPEGDSYNYLSITLVKENDEWKIESYGLEK